MNFSVFCLVFLITYFIVLFDSIHLCVTHLHTEEGRADAFVRDVEEAVAVIKQNPQLEVDGKVSFDTEFNPGHNTVSVPVSGVSFIYTFLTCIVCVCCRWLCMVLHKLCKTAPLSLTSQGFGLMPCITLLTHPKPKYEF